MTEHKNGEKELLELLAAEIHSLTDEQYNRLMGDYGAKFIDAEPGLRDAVETLRKDEDIITGHVCVYIAGGLYCLYCRTADGGALDMTYSTIEALVMENQLTVVDIVNMDEKYVSIGVVDE